MDHERFDELKDAFVLGALPEEERREFEEYLAEHPDRQAEIDELGTIAGLLALSPEEQEPPQDLRQRIMDVVEAEAGHPGVERRPVLARMREFLGVRGVALGAAAMLLIALFAWNLFLQAEIRDLQEQARSSQPSQAYRVVELKGPGEAHGAKAEVMIVQDEHAVLMVEDMPPVPQDKTLQIWVIEDDVPKPGGLFEPKREMTIAVVQEPLDGADAIAVSVEPESGSPEPTTDPMFAARL
jgi:anti-sigma-K factor RskA